MSLMMGYVFLVPEIFGFNHQNLRKRSPAFSKNAYVVTLALFANLRALNMNYEIDIHLIPIRLSYVRVYSESDHDKLISGLFTFEFEAHYSDDRRRRSDCRIPVQFSSIVKNKPGYVATQCVYIENEAS